MLVWPLVALSVAAAASTSSWSALSSVSPFLPSVVFLFSFLFSYRYCCRFSFYFFLSLFFFFYFKIGFLHVCRRRHGGKLHDVFLYSVLTSAKVHFFKFTRIQCVVLNKSQQNKKLFPIFKTIRRAT